MIRGFHFHLPNGRDFVRRLLILTSQTAIIRLLEQDFILNIIKVTLRDSKGHGSHTSSMEARNVLCMIAGTNPTKGTRMRCIRYFRSN